MLRSLFLAFVSLLLAGQTFSQSFPDHGAWDELLKLHVDEAGNVDYAKLKQDPTKLLYYINYLGAFEPNDDWPRAEKLAYYINLYNAATIKLILDHYPVKSIKDISNPWGDEWIPVGSERLSLGEIEHRILRKMDEPRIHFAINCASYSCPKMTRWAYTAEKIEAQLREATRSFLNDPERNRISKDHLYLSQIFRWFKKDFTTSGTLIDYIAGQLGTEIPEQTPVSYLSYDWRLNDAK